VEEKGKEEEGEGEEGKAVEDEDYDTKGVMTLISFRNKYVKKINHFKI
jgi:hypothetical protein